MSHCNVFNVFYLSVLLGVAVPVNSAELTLDTAVRYALSNEPWLRANRYQQDAINAQSIAAGTLPDPVLTIGFMNLPTNGFALDQEGMTQFKVGVSQMFNRGDSAHFKQQALAQSAEQYPWLRRDRLAQVKVTVTESWLNAYRAQKSIALIQNDKVLFTQLVEITESSYASAMGKTRQQDVIRAQLELTRLEDKLMVLEQQLVSAKKRLAQWLPISMLELPVSSTLAKVVALHDFSQLAFNNLTTLLLKHPSVVAIDKVIAAKNTQIAVAQQGYKPQIGVNTSYGYRGDTPMGESRADLFSVGVSIDLPLFTDNRQDQLVKAAIAETEATKTQKLIALNKLKGLYFKEVGQLVRLQQRGELYKNSLLPQVSEQAQATLNAYTRDDGEFSEVMRARISELNVKIDALNIQVDQQIILARLNYYASAADKDVMAGFGQVDTNEY